MDLDAAFEFSRYASRLRTGQPELATQVLRAIDRPASIDTGDLGVDGAAPDAAALAAALRALRARVGLATLLRDLTGRANLTEVCATQTRLAELAIEAAVGVHHQLLVRTHGEPLGADSGEPQRLIVVAMGKLGGAELNASSDVDLVFAYPEDGATTGPKRLANQEFSTASGGVSLQHSATLPPRGLCFASTCA